MGLVDSFLQFVEDIFQAIVDSAATITVIRSGAMGSHTLLVPEGTTIGGVMDILGWEPHNCSFKITRDGSMGVYNTSSVEKYFYPGKYYLFVSARVAGC